MFEGASKMNVQRCGEEEKRRRWGKWTSHGPPCDSSSSSISSMNNVGLLYITWTLRVLSREVIDAA